MHARHRSSSAANTELMELWLRRIIAQVASLETSILSSAAVHSQRSSRRVLSRTKSSLSTCCLHNNVSHGSSAALPDVP